MVFKGGGLDLIPDDGKWIETTQGASWRALHPSRMLEAVGCVAHDSRQKQVPLLGVDSGDNG
jgi:hypothetical protein